MELGGTDLVRGPCATALAKGRKNNWLSLWSEVLRDLRALRGLMYVKLSSVYDTARYSLRNSTAEPLPPEKHEYRLLMPYN